METLNMLVPATSRFFEENVDALKFDEMEKVPDDVTQGMKELGAFGLQVRRILSLSACQSANPISLQHRFMHCTELHGLWDGGIIGN